MKNCVLTDNQILVCNRRYFRNFEINYFLILPSKDEYYVLNALLPRAREILAIFSFSQGIILSFLFSCEFDHYVFSILIFHECHLKYNFGYELSGEPTQFDR